MPLPVIAIVGRPNVGKSSLLNRLAGSRIAIVDPTPGVTRDRLSVTVALGRGDDARYVELVDTGGIGMTDSDDLSAEVEDQIAFGISAADMILFVVDAREGITALDRHVAERLRKENKPVVLLANKVDLPDLTSEAGELFALGFGQPVMVSAAHGEGMHELIDRLAQDIGPAASVRPDKGLMKLAVVGKRNAGKSTLINTIAGQKRVIVSEKPGTTRDSVDVTVTFGGRTFTLIDTAGIRKQKSLSGDLEFYSHNRAMRSIRRADVVALMIDASLPLSQVDKSLAGVIAEQLKPVLLVVNKWDLARDKANTDDYHGYLSKSLPGLGYAPISFASAAEGLNVGGTIDLAVELFEQANTRVTTGRLNAAVAEILELRGPSHKAGTRPPRIYYSSQVSTAPPTIVCFVNDPRSFDESYQRFLVGQLRDRLPFAEVPIRLIIRAHRGG
jgi:GTP-binding protein